MNILSLSSRPGSRFQAARRRSTIVRTSAKVCEQMLDLCARSINKPWRAPRTPTAPHHRLSYQPSLPAQTSSYYSASLRHVLIRTTGSSSLTTRRSVRASLSPIVRLSGQHPRTTSVISQRAQLCCSFHVECDCYTCSHLICNSLWNSRAVCGATRRACFLASRPGSTAGTTSMGRPRSAALEDLVIGLNWTGRGSCSRIKASVSAAVSSHATRCTQHAEPRTTT